MAATLAPLLDIDLQCPEPIETAADWAEKVDRLALRMWLTFEVRKYENLALKTAVQGSGRLSGGALSARWRHKAEVLREVIAHIEAMQK